MLEKMKPSSPRHQSRMRCFIFVAPSALALAAPCASLGDQSFAGYSGAFNTPSAYTAPRGSASLQYSNAFINASAARHNSNAIGNFGLTDFFEVGGRISWDTARENLYTSPDGGIRDLSANVKMSVPGIPEKWFKVAIGAEDIGGQANLFSAKYIVASKQFDFARIDAGSGFGAEPGHPLSGEFVALELQPTSWLGLIAERDATSNNAGFRLHTALNEGVFVSLNAMLHTDNPLAEGRQFASVSVTLPMDSPTHYSKAPSSSPGIDNAPLLQKPFEPPQQDTATLETPRSLDQHYFESVKDVLVKDHFENVLTGERNGEFYVCIENNQFATNDLDALGWVAKRTASITKGAINRVHIFLLKEKIPVIEMVISPDNYLKFIAGDNAAPLYMEASYIDSDALSAIDWHASSGWGARLRPTIELSPALTSAIATEYGLFDYSTSLQTKISLPIWTGARVSATYNQPVEQTENFDHDGPFYDNRQQSKMQEYEVQQAIAWLPGFYSALHAGHFMGEWNGAYTQTAWLSDDGAHKLTFREGSFSNEEKLKTDRHSKLYSYRYRWSQSDISMETTWGTFFEGDNGYMVELRSWFGDDAITLQYRDTDAEFIGMRWTVPLTPKRNISTSYADFKGRENWSYGIQTRINADRNLVSFGSATIPKSSDDLERVYLNLDRLSPAYLFAHRQRLREIARDIPD